VFTLPREDQALLEKLGYKRKLAAVDDAILTNAAFLNQIAANPAIFENGIPGDEENNKETLDGPHDEGLFGELVAVSQTTNIHSGSRRRE
jgi:carnosine N-methyltransferase